jgi:hypothetical protein
VGEPTKLPVVLELRMVAVAVPLASTPPLVAVTAIVNVWVVPIVVRVPRIDVVSRNHPEL